MDPWDIIDRAALEIRQEEEVATMTAADDHLFSYQLPLDQRCKQQEAEDLALVERFTAMAGPVHDRAQGYKLFIARRLYQLSREGVFPQTPVRRSKHQGIVEGTGAVILVSVFEPGSSAWAFVEPDGGMRTGDAYSTGAAPPNSLGIDLRATRQLTDSEYVAWAPAALAAIRDALRQAA